MKKKVWVVDFTISPPSLGGLSRFYYFKKIMDSSGREFDISLFTSSFFYNQPGNYYKPREKLICKTINIEGVDFHLIKTPRFRSLLSRVYSIELFTNRFCKYLVSTPINCRPDLIYVSVSPELSLAIKVENVARKNGIPVILEVRDLYPETLVAVGKTKNNSFVFSQINAMAKKAYGKADAIVFTVPGCKQYLIDKKWDIDNNGFVDLARVFHITNGLDLAQYQMEEHNHFHDNDLIDDSFKIVYTGTISRSNNLEFLLAIAKKIRNPKLKFLIYGTGPRAKSIEETIQKQGITNVFFKGFVLNSFIPSLLSQADATLFLLKPADIYQYGISLNKLPKYLASGKPLIFVGKCAYSVIDKYHCGVSVDNVNPEVAARQIEEFYALSDEEKRRMGENAKTAAPDFDYVSVSKDFARVVDGVIRR
jgi:glycosyltransferase involved in cell wall biosynthesis